MGIVPARCFHGPRGLGGRFLLLNHRIIYAQVNGGTLRLCQLNLLSVALVSTAVGTHFPHPICLWTENVRKSLENLGLALQNFGSPS